MKNLSANLKYMLQGFNDFKYLLVTTFYITNFIAFIPLKKRKGGIMDEADIHGIVCILVHQNFWQ